MASPEPTSLRSLAKQLGVTLRAVQKAAISGRFARSVTRDSEGQWHVLDPDLAEREWAFNADRTKAAASVHDRETRRVTRLAGAGRRASGSATVTIGAERFSVLTDRELVLLAVLPAEVEATDPAAAEAWLLLPMTADVVRRLAAALASAADRASAPPRDRG